MVQWEFRDLPWGDLDNNRLQVAASQLKTAFKKKKNLSPHYLEVS